MVHRQRKHIWKVFSGLPKYFGTLKICTDQAKTNVGAVFLSDVVDNVLVLA